jgi:hypothetical protein
MYKHVSIDKITFKSSLSYNLQQFLDLNNNENANFASMRSVITVSDDPNADIYVLKNNNRDLQPTQANDNNHHQKNFSSSYMVDPRQQLTHHQQQQQQDVQTNAENYTSDLKLDMNLINSQDTSGVLYPTNNTTTISCYEEDVNQNMGSMYDSNYANASNHVNNVHQNIDANTSSINNSHYNNPVLFAMNYSYPLANNIISNNYYSNAVISNNSSNDNNSMKYVQNNFVVNSPAFIQRPASVLQNQQQQNFEDPMVYHQHQLSQQQQQFFYANAQSNDNLNQIPTRTFVNGNTVPYPTHVVSNNRFETNTNNININAASVYQFANTSTMQQNFDASIPNGSFFVAEVNNNSNNNHEAMFEDSFTNQNNYNNNQINQFILPHNSYDYQQHQQQKASTLHMLTQQQPMQQQQQQQQIEMQQIRNMHSRNHPAHYASAAHYQTYLKNQVHNHSININLSRTFSSLSPKNDTAVSYNLTRSAVTTSTSTTTFLTTNVSTNNYTSPTLSSVSSSTAAATTSKKN